MNPARQHADSAWPVVMAAGIVKRLGRAEVLRGVDLTATAGEAVAVTGPSGSGKSTLLAVLAVLTRWDEGTLALGGIPVPAPPRRRTGRRAPIRIAWVPQLPMVLPGRSVLDNVLVARRLAGGVGAGDLAAARELLDKVGLDGLAARSVSVLSGGELQRVAVARALLTGAPLILADEPTGSLDRGNSDRVIEALISNRGLACVIVATHDDRVAGACSRVVRLVDGRVEERW